MYRVLCRSTLWLEVVAIEWFAQAPTEKPGGACQHVYIRDSLPPSREDGREMSVPAKAHEQPHLTESDLLGSDFGSD